MKRHGLHIAVAVFVLALVFFAAGLLCGGEPLTKQVRSPLRPWRPALTATISSTSIWLGESIHVAYSTKNATGCLRDWTQLRPFIGRSDGIVIPTQGSYTHTPREVGTFTTRMMATRRLGNLNGNGREEGWRRAVILEFEVEVRP
jgi:hypothetical protein